MTLDTDSYQHKIKAFGRIKVPVFKIVDCVEAAPFNAMVAEARGGAGFIPASVSSPALVTPHEPDRHRQRQARAGTLPPSILPTDEQSPPEEAPVPERIRRRNTLLRESRRANRTLRTSCKPCNLLKAEPALSGAGPARKLTGVARISSDFSRAGSRHG